MESYKDKLFPEKKKNPCIIVVRSLKFFFCKMPFISMTGSSQDLYIPNVFENNLNYILSEISL